MRINQNIMAFDAYRNLSLTEGKMGKSLEKLSSGHRINRAADDACRPRHQPKGLGAQVSGLQQATRNAQDGVSVAQTAEGALNEVTSMLNRIRDLAVQASNTGSNDVNARTAAQGEVAQLTAEIDRISASTRFGSQNLLDGNFGGHGVGASGTSAQLSGPGLVVTAGTNDQFKVTIGATTVTATVAAGTVQQRVDAAVGISNALSTRSTGAGLAVDTVVGDRRRPRQRRLRQGGVRGLGAFTLVAGANDFLASTGVAAGAAAPAGTSATFQVGPEASDTINMGIAAVTTAGLGIGGLDLINNGERGHRPRRHGDRTRCRAPGRASVRSRTASSP